MKKRSKIIIAIVIVLIVVYGGVQLLSKKMANSIKLDSVNFVQKMDGVYEGDYANEVVKAKVQLTIEEGKVTKIDILKHQNGLGGNANKIIDSVIKEQSLKVDTVSGATISSKVILKAIENALER